MLKEIEVSGVRAAKAQAAAEAKQAAKKDKAAAKAAQRLVVLLCGCVCVWGKTNTDPHARRHAHARHHPGGKRKATHGMSHCYVATGGTAGMCHCFLSACVRVCACLWRDPPPAPLLLQRLLRVVLQSPLLHGHAPHE